MQEHTERAVCGLLSTLDKPVNMCFSALLSTSTICMASHDQRMEPVRPEGSTAIVETFLLSCYLAAETGGGGRASEQKVTAHKGEAAVLGYPGRNTDAYKTQVEINNYKCEAI